MYIHVRCDKSSVTNKCCSYRRLASTWQNNRAGVPWCPERLAVSIFIIIWHQRLVAKKTGHEAHELARNLGKQGWRTSLPLASEHIAGWPTLPGYARVTLCTHMLTT